MIKFKAITLNIWRYDGNWEARKQKIISFINQEKPDILFLQEVFDDDRHNKPRDHQALQLNRNLGFKHCLYDVVEMVTRENNQPINVPVFDGLACLTNVDVINHELIRLTRAKDDCHFRAIQKVHIQFKGQEFIFFHTHFSNRADWARFHLEETLTIADKEPIQPIIIGDLNILDINDVKDVFDRSSLKYICSYDVRRYVSFPAKNEVLDYVLLPEDFRFTDIICEKDGLADHRPLVTVIESVYSI